jgi:hypothetical protein
MTAAKTTRTRKTTAAKPTKPALKIVDTETPEAPATKPAATRTRKAPAKPAAKTPAKPAPAQTATPAERSGLKELTERAAKAKATRAAASASGEQRTCEGCKETKAITKFPTTSANKDGVMGRGKTCRACRDTQRSTKKK